MKRFPIQFRHERFSLREKRLLGRVATPEVLKKAAAVAEELKLKNPNEETVTKAVVSLDPKQREAFIDQVHSNLQTLTPDLQKIASANLERLIRTSTGYKLNVLSGVVEAMKAGEKEGKKKGFIEKATEMWEQSSINPSNWSKSSKRNAQLVAVGAVVVAGVFVLKKVWDFFRGTTKKAAAGVKTGFGWLWNVVILGAVVGGGVYAFHKIQQLTDTMKGLGNLGRGKVDSLGRRVDRIDTRNAQQEEADIQAKAAVEKQYKDAVRQYEAVYDAKTGSIKPGMKAKAAGLSKALLALRGSNAFQSLTEEQQDECKRMHKVIEAELVTEAAKNVTYANLAKIILVFHGNEGVTDVHLQGILQRNSGRSMAVILDSSKQLSERLEFDDAPADGPAKAAQFLIDFCADRTARAKQVTGKEIEDLSLREFFESIVQGYAAAGKLRAKLVNSEGKNILDLMQSLDMSKLLGEDSGANKLFESIVRKLSDDGKLPKGWEDISKRELLTKTMEMGTVNIVVFLDTSKSEILAMTPEKQIIHAVLWKIALEIKKDDKDLPKYFHAFIHGVKVRDTGHDPSDIKHAHALLCTQMTLSEALRFYMYKDMIAAGNPAGVLMMQVGALKYIYKEEEPSWLAKNVGSALHYHGDFHFAWQQALSAFASEGAKDIVDELPEGGLAAKAVLAAAGTVGMLSKFAWTNMAARLLNLGAQGVAALGIGIWRNKENPWMYGGVAGTTAGIVVWRKYFGRAPADVLVDLNKYSSALKNRGAVRKLATSVGPSRWLTRWRLHDAMETDFGNATTSYRSLEDLCRRWAPKGSVGKQFSSMAAKLPAGNDGWKDFAKFARSKGADAVAELAVQMAGTPGAESVNVFAKLEDAIAHLNRRSSQMYKFLGACGETPTSAANWAALKRFADEKGADGIGRLAKQFIDDAGMRRAFEIISWNRGSKLQRLTSWFTRPITAVTMTPINKIRSLFRKPQMAARVIAIIEELKLTGKPAFALAEAIAKCSKADDLIALFTNPKNKRLAELVAADRRLLLLCSTDPGALIEVVKDMVIGASTTADAILGQIKTSQMATRPGAFFDALPDLWKNSDVFTKMRAGYKDSALDAFDAAAKRLSQMDNVPLERAIVLLGDKSVIDVLGNVKVFGGAHIDEAVRVALVGTDTAKAAKAVQRTVAYVSALGSSHATEAMVDKKILSFIAKWDGADPAFLAKFVSKLQQTARVGKGTAAAKAAAAALADSGEMLRMMGVARKVSLIRGFSFLMAFEVAALGFDIYSYNEAKSRVAESKKKVDTILIKNGFTKSGTETHPVYTHRKTGIRIKGAFIFQQMDAEVGHRMSNLVASSVGTAATGVAFLTPCIAFGPAGIAIAVATLAVHGAVEAFDQEDKRKLIMEMDMGVLALIGFGTAIGVGEYDALAGASNGMFSDVFHSSEYNSREKREIRKRAVICMFAQELGALSHDYPSLHREIMGEKDMFEVMREGGDFYSDGFRKVVKPYLTMRMFQLANDEDAKWKDFRDFKIDTGWFDWTNIDIGDIRLAIRESAILYVQHIRERKYRIARAALATQEKGEPKEGEKITSTARIHELASQKAAYRLQKARVTALGTKMSFGVPVSSLKYKNIDDPTHIDDPTQVELILAAARIRLDSKVNWKAYHPGWSGKYSHPAHTDKHYSPRPRKEFGGSDFSLTIPKGLVPEHKGSRTVQLWTLPYIALSNDAEQDPALRRATFTKRLSRIRSKTGEWNEYRQKDGIRALGYLGLTQKDKDNLRDLMMLLYQYPEYDPDGSIRESLKSTESWEAGEADGMSYSSDGRKLDHKHIGINFPYRINKHREWTDGPIWLLPYLLAPVSQETDKGKRYSAFMSGASSVSFGNTFDRWKPKESWVFISTYVAFNEYYAVLSQYPEFDKDGSMRKAIRSLSQYKWNLKYPYGSHPLAKEAKKMYDKIQSHKTKWEMQRYSFLPWKPENVKPRFVPVDTSPSTSFFALAELRKRIKNGNTDTIPSFESLGSVNAVDPGAVRKTMYVHVDGKEEPVRIDARRPVTVNQTAVTDHHIEGVGTFFCKATKRRSDRGKVTTRYLWYYKAEANPVQFHVTIKNTKGFDLPGQRFDVIQPRNERTVNLHEHIHMMKFPINEAGVSITILLGNTRTGTYNCFEYVKMQEDFGQYITLQKIYVGSRWSSMVIIPKNRGAIASITIKRDIESYSSQKQYKLTNETYTFKDSKESVSLSEKVQKLHAEAVLYLGLKEQQKGVFTRKGYGGLYILQPDGTVYWTGGRIESKDKNSRASTYMDGIWSGDDVPPLDPAIERITLWAGNEFTVPRRRYYLDASDEYSRTNVRVVLDPDKPFPAEFLKHWTIRSEKNRWIIKPKKVFLGMYRFRDLETGHLFELKGTVIEKNAIQNRIKAREKFAIEMGQKPPIDVPKWISTYKYAPPTDVALPGELDPAQIKQQEAEKARKAAELQKKQLAVLQKATGITDFTFLSANRFIVETNQKGEKSFTGLYYFVGEILYRTDGRTDYATELVAAAAYKEGTWKEISDRGAGRHRMLILQTQFSLKKHEDGYYTQEGFDGRFYFLRDGIVHRTAGKRGDEEFTAALFDGQKWSDVVFGSPEYDQQKWNEWERKSEGNKVLSAYVKTLGLTKHKGGYYTLTGNTCRYYARLSDRKIYRSAGRTTGGTDLPPALYSGKGFESTSALPISEEVIKAYEGSRERSMLLKGGPEFAVTLTDADGKRTTVIITPDSTSPVSIGTLGNLNKNTDGNWLLSLPDNSPVAEVEYVTSYGYRVRSPIMQGEDEFVKGPDRRFAVASNSFSVDDSLYNTVKLVFVDGTTEQIDYKVPKSFDDTMRRHPDALRKYLYIETSASLTHFRLKEGVKLRSCTFTKKKEKDSTFSTDMKDAMTLEWSTAS